MTGSEALQALRDGKSVRRKYWLPEQYLLAKLGQVGECWTFYLNPTANEIDEECRVINNGLFFLEELMEDDWEIVE